jgi:putative oxidoreductase
MTGTASFAALLGRLLLAAIFLMSGFGKLAAPTATIAYIASSGGMPFPSIAYAGAVIVEIGFSIALVFGFHTRFVAVVMTLFALATAFAFHAHFDDKNQTIHFMKNIAIAGGFLQVAAFGGGMFSLDARRARRSASLGRY